MGQHETIPNRRLRQALEFALEVAADVDGTRPVPDTVRRHLRRPISPQAIGPLRRAIDSDDDFRAVVASRLVDATAVSAGGEDEDEDDDVDVEDEGPVDPIGSLWLLRPPGWREAVDLLLELERQQAEIDAIDAARRREEKRREAAEAHVERERTERDRLQRRLDAQSAQLIETNDRLAVLQRELETARHELIEARMHVRHAGDRERAAVERLQRLEAERRSPAESGTPEPDAPESIGDTGTSAGALADDGRSGAAWRATVAEALIDRLRRAGDDLVETLIAEITDRLGTDDGSRVDGTDVGAGDGVTAHRTGRADGRSADRIAVAPRSEGRDEVTAPRPDRRRRRALRMPPGVVSESMAGVEFLLRSGARVIVDGYNVSKTAWPHLELIDQRERLVTMLGSLVERYGIDVQVIFDGADVVGASTARRRTFDIVFSPAGVLADEVIGREVRRLPPDRPVVVVTDDRAVRDDARSCGANIVASTALVEFGLR